MVKVLELNGAVGKVNRNGVGRDECRWDGPDVNGWMEAGLV